MQSFNSYNHGQRVRVCTQSQCSCPVLSLSSHKSSVKCCTHVFHPFTSAFQPLCVFKPASDRSVLPKRVNTYRTKIVYFAIMRVNTGKANQGCIGEIVSFWLIKYYIFSKYLVLINNYLCFLIQYLNDFVKIENNTHVIVSISFPSKTHSISDLQHL